MGTPANQSRFPFWTDAYRALSSRRGLRSNEMRSQVLGSKLFLADSGRAESGVIGGCPLATYCNQSARAVSALMHLHTSQLTLFRSFLARAAQMERNESSFPASDENDAMEAWCEAYLASDLSSEDMYLFYEFRDDVLDEEEYEDQVKSLATYQVVTEGVCTSCRCGLADWPAKGSDRHPTHLWRIDTLGLAAAARAGCKLCAFFLSRLDSREAGEFRKIEARFRRLGREATSQLRLEAEDGREIFLGYPGKTLDDVQTSASVSLCQTVVAHNYGKI